MKVQTAQVRVILTPPPVRVPIRRRDGRLVYVQASHVRGAR